MRLCRVVPRMPFRAGAVHADGAARCEILTVWRSDARLRPYRGSRRRPFRPPAS
jgi:hypothetical protein